MVTPPRGIFVTVVVVVPPAKALATTFDAPTEVPTQTVLPVTPLPAVHVKATEVPASVLDGVGVDMADAVTAV